MARNLKKLPANKSKNKLLERRGGASHLRPDSGVGFRLGFKPSLLLPQPGDEEREFFKLVNAGDMEDVLDFIIVRAGLS